MGLKDHTDFELSSAVISSLRNFSRRSETALEDSVRREAGGIVDGLKVSDET